MTFIQELTELCDKHKIHLSGTLRVIELDDRWDLDSRHLAVKPTVKHGGIPDATGPFLVASIEQVPAKPVAITPSARIHINSDISGYDCPITGQWIGSRREHRENLKRKGCRNLEPGESREAQRNQQRAMDEGCKRTAHELVAAIAHHVEV